MQRRPLPIDPFLPCITEALKDSGTLVIEAEPGAGKTTRVPAAVLESGMAGEQRICVLEPRRIAARLAALRVASELGCRPGGLVGYRVRFDELVSAETRLEFMTEGILLRRLASDPALFGVGAVILDEVHERHLETDAALSLLRRLRETVRPDLRLAVMSATLDAQAFSRFLGGAPTVRVPGRQHRVEVIHQPLPDSRPLEDQVASCLSRALREGDDGGDILVFLPGAAEIRRTAERCGPWASARDIAVRVLHGDLSSEDQDKAVREDGGRKLILATNIAESSLTLSGVTCVIDSGLARIPRSDAWTGIMGLQAARVSKASCIQRAGRAGRVRDGRCFRLFCLYDFETRDEHTVPEILRLDLTPTALLLHGVGVRRLDDLAWLDRPPEAQAAAAERLLKQLGALDETGCLTDAGRRMLSLPVHPRLARVMVEAERRGAGRSGALLASLMAEKPIRRLLSADASGKRTQARDTVASDAVEELEIFEAAAQGGFSAGMLRSFDLDAGAVHAADKSFRRLARMAAPDRPGLGGEAREQALLVSILAGYPDRVAMRRKGDGSGPSDEVLLCGGGTARLSPQSGVRDSGFMVALDVEERGLGARKNLTIRRASEIEPEWLIDLFEGGISESAEIVWNAAQERAESRARLCYGRLVLSESASAPPPEEGEHVLFRAAQEAGIGRFVKAEQLSSLQARAALARRFFPELDIPQADETWLREVLAAHCRGRLSFRELEEEPLLDRLRMALFGEAAFRLDRLFPSEMTLPGGRRLRIHYETDGPPWIESRLQDFFGERRTPAIAEGRLPLVLHLLAPNQRPVQVTSDLAGFWERHYPELRKSLARRYPKHAWPEDPLLAQPPKPDRRRS